MGELAAVVLAFVFSLSAILKLVDRPGTIAGFTELQVPAPPMTLWLVIVAELSVAVGTLLLPPSAWAAVALLMAFTAFLAARMREGTTASCRCFGTTSHKPLSWKTLARNAALTLVAIVATTATF